MTTLSVASGGKATSMGCFMLLVALAALVMLSVAGGVGQSISHAFKHGADAEAVHQCLNRNGHSSLWMNPYNEHYLRVCDLPDGRAGLQVVKKVRGKWEEITAFIPKEQIMKYLSDCDAVLIWPK